jgi:hypothetical protein
MSRIADDVFLMLLDDRSGEPRAARRIAGLTVAAGMLGELLTSSCLSITTDGEIELLDAGWPPHDELEAEVYKVIHESNSHPLRTWLDYLALDAWDRVGQRLAHDEVVQVVVRRRLMSKRIGYVPTDSSAALVPVVRIACRFTGEVAGEELKLPDVISIGLIAVAGLLDQVWWDEGLHTRARAALPEVLSRLPLDHPVTQLFAVTESAVAEAVLTSTT